MIRLYVVAEGVSEVNFISQVLRPYLEERTKGELVVAAPSRLGGRYKYAELKKVTRALLGAPRSAVVITTMIDLFRLPSDFPGRAHSFEIAAPMDRVKYLEGCVSADIDDARFVPYLQLHEFEALVLAGLELLERQYPNRGSAIRELSRRLDKDFESPEHVNHRQPPSYRIKEAVPEYNKPIGGVTTVAQIGLPKLCERCLHFSQWLARLETIAAGSS